MIYVLSGLLFVIFVGAIAHDCREIRKGAFSFCAFVAGFHLLFYGVFPVWVVNFERFPVYPLRITGDVFAYVLFFVVVQLAGYVIGRRVLDARFAPAAPQPAPMAARRDGLQVPDRYWTVIAAFAFILGHLAFSVFEGLQSVPSISQLRQPLWLFGLAALAWLAANGSLGRTATLGMAAAFVFECWIGLDRGLITGVAFSLTVLLLVAFMNRRLAAAAVIAVAALTVVLSYGYVKHFSREVMRGELTSINRFLPDFSLMSFAASFEAAARRSAHLLVLQKVRDRVEAGGVPEEFERHTPFRDALINHLPRLLWPDKPRETLGNRFGKAFDFIEAKDDATSWNVPWTADFGLALGFAGAVGASFVVGVLLAAGASLISKIRDPALATGLFAASLFPLYYQESNFSLMAGSLFWVLAFFGAAIWTIGRLRRLTA